MLYGAMIHGGASGPSRMLFNPFVPPGLRKLMPTVEPEALMYLRLTGG